MYLAQEKFHNRENTSASIEVEPGAFGIGATLDRPLLLGLTFSSIYTHFDTLKKKASGKHCGKS